MKKSEIVKTLAQEGYIEDLELNYKGNLITAIEENHLSSGVTYTLYGEGPLFEETEFTTVNKAVLNKILGGGL